MSDEQRIAELEARIIALETALALILEPIADQDSMIHKGTARWILYNWEWDEGMDKMSSWDWEQRQVRAYLAAKKRAEGE